MSGTKRKSNMNEDRQLSTKETILVIAILISLLVVMKFVIG